MERMVTDKDITHVLVMSDRIYAEKADKRKAGVGTESQIISNEVYQKVEQTKFLPIVCEFDERNEPYLPTFFKTRIWIDFSTPQAVNENWERLIRHLFGKPLHKKPELGKVPVYIQEDYTVSASPILAKYSTFQQAFLQGKPGINLYRGSFLDACIEFADSLRVRTPPDMELLGEKVLADCNQLKHVRNHIIDWVLLETTAAPSTQFNEALIELLERLLELKSRPCEINSWSDVWFEAHSLFVYETFLYIVAALLKRKSFETLHEVFASQYIKPKSDRYGPETYTNFGTFYGDSGTLKKVLLSPEGKEYLNPAAELLKRQSDRKDLPFSAIIEAELLVFLMVLIKPGMWWYPNTYRYSKHQDHPFFIRTTQNKGFHHLTIITHIGDPNTLREAVKSGLKRLNVESSRDFIFLRNTFWDALNMDKLDTLK